MVKYKITRMFLSSFLIMILVATSFVGAPVLANEGDSANLLHERSDDDSSKHGDRKLIDVVATKKWSGGSAPRPIVYLKLFRNVTGQEPKAVDVEVLPIISGTNTEINVTWDDLPKTDGTGKTYTYSVREYVNVSDDPDELRLIYGAPFNYLKNERGLVVTNTYRELVQNDNRTFVEVKKTWESVQENFAPTASFSLYDVNHPDEKITGLITYPDTTFIFNDLPAYTSGPNRELIEYVVVEELLPNYTQTALVKKNAAISALNRVTPNNLMELGLGYNPSFVITKPTGGQPFIIWTLNYVPDSQKAAFISSFLASAQQFGANIGPFSNININNPITWIFGSSVLWDVYPSDSNSGLIDIEILYNPDGSIADNSTIEFQNPKTWTQFVVGAHSPTLYEITNSYEALGSFTPRVTKSLLGRDLNENEFFFQLYKDGVAVGSPVGNDGDGNVVFPEVYFTGSQTGTHNYTIREVVGTIPGIDYSDEIIGLSVSVLELYDGTIQATPTYTNNKNSFTNTYSATGSIQLSTQKVLQGRDLLANEFTFGLYKGDTLLMQATNDAGGNVLFGSLDFDSSDVGVHNYTIKEMAGTKGGITYSTQVVNVTISVHDDGSGTLVIIPTYTLDSFTNTYTATGSIEIVVFKDLIGRTLKQGEFTFDLFEGETLIATATNAASGSVTFAPLNFTLADVGTKSYTVKERVGTLGGITYSSEVLHVNVEVIDNGLGVLNVSSTYDHGKDTITNLYDAEGSFSPSVLKVLDAGGRNLIAGEFSFVLKDSTGTIIQTKYNLVTGLVLFDALEFEESDAGKTFTYTIEEVDLEEEGMLYDPHVVTLTISVIDNGDGTIALNTKYTGDTTFRNNYRAQGSITPQLTKVLNGRNLVLSEFTFNLYKGDTLIDTATNNSDGSIVFNTIFYTEADIGKVFTYTIKEVNSGLGGITYDGSIKTLEVIVSDGLNGDLIVSDEYSSTTFTNEYRASGGFSPRLTKELLAGGRTLVLGEFSFELRDKDNVLIQTLKNDADGNVTFDEIMYTQSDIGKTFTYTLTEIKGSETAMSYDPKSIIIFVSVVDSGVGLLNLAVSYSEASVFTNTYTATGSITPSITKNLEGRALVDGEFSFALMLDERIISIAQNDTLGNVVFDALNYTQNDIGKSYSYTIVELTGTKGGITYDNTIISLLVDVLDGKNGTLDITAHYSGSEFNNIYTSTKASVLLYGHKTLEGRVLKAGEFVFELYEATSEGILINDKILTAENDIDGNFAFDALEFEQGMSGAYYFAVVEKPGTLAGVSYDEAVLLIRIDVTDNLNGQMNATVTYLNESLNFINYYVPESAKVSIEANKVLLGRRLVNYEFMFELLDSEGNVIATAPNIGGKITFNLVLDEVGNYSYKIREVKGTASYIAYDDTIFDVDVSVTDSLEGDLIAVVTHEDLTFVNEYISNPKIDVKKTARLVNGKLAFTEVGEVIEFMVSATNLGDTVLQGVRIIDDLEGLYNHRFVIVHTDGSTTLGVANGAATLLPNEKLVMYAYYDVTAEDLARKVIKNIATARGYEPSPDDPLKPRDGNKPTLPDKPATAEVIGKGVNTLPATGLGMTNFMVSYMLIGAGVLILLRRRKES